MPSVAIEPRIGAGPTITITPCDGVTLVLPMANGTTIFEEGGLRGLENRETQAIFGVLEDRGGVEFTSPTAEYMLRLPADIVGPLYAAFAGRNGQALEEDIYIGEGEEDEPEDPEQAAGRKRRLRVQKQTRRTQRKRRDTVRKKF